MLRVIVHNVLMAGPTGAGKTLLARALPGILEHISNDEALDVTRIYSVVDQLPPDPPLVRPARSGRRTIPSPTPDWWAAATSRGRARFPWRIDIHIEAPRVGYDKLSDSRLSEPSSAIQRCVEGAREIQRPRFTERAQQNPDKSSFL